eukprot:9935055-Heterocapsa_arctica.AAC.1
MEPGTFTIEGANSAAAYIDPGKSACHTGNTLDWRMVSGGLAMAAHIKVEQDTQIYAHYPVRLKVGGSLSQDMGQRIKRPMAFQGLYKERGHNERPT